MVDWPAREENVGDADRDQYDDSRRGICRIHCLGLCEPPDDNIPDRHAATFAESERLNMTSVGNPSWARYRSICGDEEDMGYIGSCRAFT